jgi:hypothetical protein
MLLLELLNKNWLLHPYDEPVVMEEKDTTYLDKYNFFL